MKKSSADELGNTEHVRTFDHFFYSIIVYISIWLFTPNFEEIESECCEGTINKEEGEQEVSRSAVTELRSAKQYVSCPKSSSWIYSER